MDWTYETQSTDWLPYQSDGPDLRLEDWFRRILSNDEYAVLAYSEDWLLSLIAAATRDASDEAELRAPRIGLTAKTRYIGWKPSDTNRGVLGNPFGIGSRAIKRLLASYGLGASAVATRIKDGEKFGDLTEKFGKYVRAQAGTNISYAILARCLQEDRQPSTIQAGVLARHIDQLPENVKIKWQRLCNDDPEYLNEDWKSALRTGAIRVDGDAIRIYCRQHRLTYRLLSATMKEPMTARALEDIVKGVRSMTLLEEECFAMLRQVVP